MHIAKQIQSGLPSKKPGIQTNGLFYLHYYMS